jgi:O-antigen/teichoic acid export membrane protein
VNLVTNIVSTLLARLIVLGLALVSSVLLARLLGPEGRGLFALVLLLPELARNLASIGFEQATTVYAGLEPNRRPALLWQSAAIAGCVGGLAAAAGSAWLALGAPGFPTLVQGPLWLYLLPLSTLPVLMFGDYCAAILRGMNRILLLNLVEVTAKVASLVLLVGLLGVLGFGVAGAVIANSATGVAGVALILALLGGAGALARPTFDVSLWHRVRKFALPAYCTGVLGYLTYRADQILIAAFLPREHLAFYVIAVDLAERLWILTGSAANALLPHLTNSSRRDPATSAVVARHVTAWTAAACLIAFLLADVVVRVLYSPAYGAAAAPLRWLLPGVLVLSIGKILVGDLLARERVRPLAMISALGAVSNLIGNVLLIPVMGISGAAFASTISYSLVAVLLIRLYLRATGMSWRALVPSQRDALAYWGLCKRTLAVASVSRRSAP